MTITASAKYECNVCKSQYVIGFDVPVRSFPLIAMTGIHFSGGAGHGPEGKCFGKVWNLVAGE